MTLAIAWKNLWRSKRRSLIIIISATLGLWGGVYSSALFWGMVESMVNTAIDDDMGHIQIHKQGYVDNTQVVSYIPDGNELIENLPVLSPDIKAVSGRTIVEAMAASATSSMGLNVVGIDPEKERHITDVSESIVEGGYFTRDARNAVVIGRKLADRLKIDLNNKLVISFQALDSSITYAACRVVGIFKTSSSMFDETHLFIRQQDLWKLLEEDDIYHEIVIRTESSRMLDSTTAKIAGVYPSLDVRSWKQLAPELGLYTGMMELYTLILVGILLLALLFGITNTMFMAVLERIREIGVLLSIGMKKGRIFFMIVMETLFLSIIGGILGMILAWISISITEATGIDLSVVGEGLEAVGMGTMLYPYLPLVSYIEIFFMIIVASVLAAIFPALKAIHTQPATAIRTY